MRRVIFESRLASLASTTIDITATATPGRYRLVDCVRYTRDQILCIEEVTDISTIPYSAISYVWRGNPVDPSTVREGPGTFSVKGAEDGDPISIDTLHHACTASLLELADHLWLDRLCIIQTNRDDKAWQIARMYGIYKSCKVCIVLPGGIGRLVSEEEETAWIERAWTLQEVTVPKRPMVLFAWEHGTGEWEGWQGGVKGRVTQVIIGKSAIMPLREMLKACFYPMALTWTPADGSHGRDDISVSILGSYGESPIGSLLWALEVDDLEGKSLAIWRCALLRASSRPVDMVFSIMGIFGVALDSRAFHKDDRIGATIALAREILHNGGKPTWLVISLDIPPSRILSTFPEFPQTDVTGEICWQALGESCKSEAGDLDEADLSPSLSLFPEDWVKDIPGGSMDDEGYLTITSKAAPIVFTGQVLSRVNTTLAKNNNGLSGSSMIRVTATDGKVWDILRHDDSDSITDECEQSSFGGCLRRAFIVFVGTACKFHRDPVLQYDPRPIGGIILPDMSPLRAIVLEEHRPGKFHRSSAFTLAEVPFRGVIGEWGERTFAIGGPEPLPPGTRRGRALMSIADPGDKSGIPPPPPPDDHNKPYTP